ncbi:MAG: pyridoxine 5'-phosphate synthase [Myxococcota bacterium]|nr:pyridoxine 5'-phosphate synthase [Myxococcota bacterium]
MDAQLHLAVDAAAMFRRVGDGVNPSTVSVALLAELAGADAISYDIRVGERNDAEKDGRLLRDSLTGRFEVVAAAGPDLMDVAFALRPDRLTLAPELRDGGVSGGIDAHMLKDALRRQVLLLKDAGIMVGVRIEPELEQCKALHRSEVDFAVLNCSAYLRAKSSQERATELARISDAANLAAKLGMRVGVVGDIDLVNVEKLARIAQIDEFQVGHACIARGILRGIEQAVGDFTRAVERGRRRSV